MRRYKVNTRLPAPLSKKCGHTGCQLETTDGCCACLDLRPFSPSGYEYYVDGMGWQMGASRKAMYCPHCSSTSPGKRRHKVDTRLPTSPSKKCGHTGCQLETTDRCCACLDRRPLNPSGYEYYVDGEGWKMGASRNSTYCPHCSASPVSSSPPSEIPEIVDASPTGKRPSTTRTRKPKKSPIAPSPAEPPPPPPPAAQTNQPNNLFPPAQDRQGITVVEANNSMFNDVGRDQYIYFVYNPPPGTPDPSNIIPVMIQPLSPTPPSIPGWQQLMELFQRQRNM